MKRLLLLLISLPLIGMDRIDPKNIQAPSKLGHLEVFHDDEGIYVHHNGQRKTIERHQCDTTLRKLIAAKKLKEFQEQDGYIKINTMGEENDDLALSAKVRGPGGGPMLSALSYLTVKVAGYSLLMCGAAGVGAVSVAAGPGGAAGTAMAMGIVAQSGGTAAYLAGLEAFAVKAACVTALWPTW